MNTVFTTDLGFALPLRPPTPSDELQAAGLHRTDSRFSFAHASFRACRPVNRAKVLTNFGYVHATVAIPPPANRLPGIDTFDAAVVAQITALQASVSELAEGNAPAAAWALLASALLHWRRNRTDVADDALFVITTILHALDEKRIARLDQAAFYALSLHAEWRDAAAAWLYALPAPWLQDWIEANPAFNMLVEDARDTLDGKPPAWLPGAYA